nr:PAS domain S-box protein [uncultured Desulfobacter sp.]
MPQRPTYEDLKKRITELETANRILSHANKIKKTDNSLDIDNATRTKDALVESNERFQAIFHGLNDAIFIHEMDTGRIVELNQKAIEKFGYTLEETQLIGLKGLSSSNSFYDEKYAMILIKKVAVDGPQIFEWQARHKTGRLFWVEVNLKKATIGAEDCILAIVRDITERKKIEAKSQRQINELFAQSESAKIVFNSIKDAIFVHPLKEKGFAPFINVNATACERYGYTNNEFMNLSVLDITVTHDSTRYGAPGHRKKLLKKGQLIFEAVNVTKSGETFPVEINSNIFYQNKKPFILSVVRDITERKRAKAALKESEEWFQLIFNNSPEAISLTRLEDGLFVDMNEGFTKMTGYTREDVIDKPVIKLDIWHNPIERKKLTKRLKEKGIVENMEACFTKKDGSSMTGLLSAKITNINGMLHIISITRDITLRKQREELALAEHIRFATAMDSLDAWVYVADIQTHEVLFINKYARDKFGDIVGEPCWKTLQIGQTGPCSFCTNNKLLDVDGKPTGPYVWEFKNTIDGEWYQCRDQAILWPDGRLVRLEVAMSISERRKLEQEREKLINELQNALENIKTLKGLLPICSMCKKIRDDEGYWNILEKYIEQHSDASFSHSLCPECELLIRQINR